MAKKKQLHLPVKQIFFSAASIMLAFFMLLAVNFAAGSPLPLPGAAELAAHASAAMDSIYRAAELSTASVSVTGDVKVHYIDVGQADCELIQTPEQTVLIDAGDTDDGDRIVDYLKAQGVSRIDLLIATHPHADHIGGMAEVVQSLEIGKILFSDVPEKLIPTTKTYEKLLNAIAAKGLKITRVKPDIQYPLGGGAMLTMLGPLKQYDKDLNESSVVCRLEYGETSFLFTGDASKESEDDLLKQYGSGLASNVLKLGHHGSDTSSQEKWLRTVAPQIAIAEVGLENSYGHPSLKILRSLKDRGIRLYRTDENGTIVLASDGKTIQVSAEK